MELSAHVTDLDQSKQGFKTLGPLFTPSLNLH